MEIRLHYCEYCRCHHEFLDFGLNFSGGRTLICSDRLSDVLVTTMPKRGYDELEDEILDT